MGGDTVSSYDDEQALRDAEATIASARVRQAMTDGTMTFTDYDPVRSRQILDALPPADELDVPTSVRLPAALHRRLRDYAEEHQTSASALIRLWVEQMLTVPDRPISLADAVRALSGLPPSQSHP